MARIVLVETNPLARLGLQQLLAAMPLAAEVIALDPRLLPGLAGLECHADLVIVGLPVAPEQGMPLLAQVARAFRPQRLVLLREADAWPASTDGLPAGVYGCVNKSVAPQVLQAVIQLALPTAMPSARHASTSLGIGAPSEMAMQDAGVLSGLLTPAHQAGEALVGFASTGMSGHTFDATQPRSGPPGRAEPVDEFEQPEPQETTLRHDAEADLLKLTPRQHEILRLLARGLSLKAVGKALGISPSTVKAHVAALYQRLHVRSKTEAVHAARARGANLD